MIFSSLRTSFENGISITQSEVFIILWIFGLAAPLAIYLLLKTKQLAQINNDSFLKKMNITEGVKRLFDYGYSNSNTYANHDIKLILSEHVDSKNHIKNLYIDRGLFKIKQISYSIIFLNPRNTIQSNTFIFENSNKILALFSMIIYTYLSSLLIIMVLLIFPLTFMGSIVGIFFLVSIFPIIIISQIFSQSQIRGSIYHKLSQQSMESLGFEKSFDAFSRDPVEARMIITPAFMDRLEEFSNKWNLHGKIRIIWEKDTFTLLLKGDIEKYGKESDGSYTLIKSMEEILNLEYYSLPLANTNNT